ncbi:hypothetical protein Vadar_020261 [Vaccinium darrowii]|uniref:Uncharacterized protein n=1 Tax=Vaccinium darrowii TaxID=229202 RepID=A0ACB7XSI8_9ERIC|nr:hypothetical protein Vadar_020261 [Vaccinium darrowii]
MLLHKPSSNVKIGDYDIPKGSNVHVNAWAVARDSKVWKNPGEFRPERFLEEDVDMKGHDFPKGKLMGVPRGPTGDQLGDVNAWSSSPPFLAGPPKGVELEEIDMTKKLELVSFMRPLYRLLLNQDCLLTSTLLLTCNLLFA